MLRINERIASLRNKTIVKIIVPILAAATLFIGNRIASSYWFNVWYNIFSLVVVVCIITINARSTYTNCKLQNLYKYNSIRYAHSWVYKLFKSMCDARLGPSRLRAPRGNGWDRAY